MLTLTSVEVFIGFNFNASMWKNTRILFSEPNLETLHCQVISFSMMTCRYFGDIVSSDMLMNYEKFVKFALFTVGIVVIVF